MGRHVSRGIVTLERVTEWRFAQMKTLWSVVVLLAAACGAQEAAFRQRQHHDAP